MLLIFKFSRYKLVSARYSNDLVIFLLPFDNWAFRVHTWRLDYRDAVGVECPCNLRCVHEMAEHMYYISKSRVFND